MSDENTKEQSDTPEGGIPAELLDTLHKANEQFHDARKHVEQAIDAEVNSLAERERAAQEVRDAEKAVEEVEEKIGEKLKKA